MIRDEKKIDNKKILFKHENWFSLEQTLNLYLKQEKKRVSIKVFDIFFLIVSHTTDDMIFQWDPDVPLVVDEHIELPQLALVKNYTADCTQVYSTGI